MLRHDSKNNDKSVVFVFCNCRTSSLKNKIACTTTMYLCVRQCSYCISRCKLLFLKFFFVLVQWLNNVFIGFLCGLAKCCRVVYLSVFSKNTLFTTALYIDPPTPLMSIPPLFNDDIFAFVRELDDILETHLSNFITHHDSTEPLHPRNVLLRVLNQQFLDHVQQNLDGIRLYSTNQQLLLNQLAENPLPPNPNPNPINHANPNTNPNPNPYTDQRVQQSSTAPGPQTRSGSRRFSYYAVRRGRSRGIFSSWEECRRQVEGISNEFKGFHSIPEAHAYLNLPPAPLAPE